MTENPPDPVGDDASARQRQAADPSHSAWVSANAGTGKTRVLTDRIARLLLRGVRPEKILCLTYTRAAAAEMKNRIAARLGEWAAMDDDALRHRLTRLTGRPPIPADLVRARQLFVLTLDSPGGIGIRTIHGFCESLLSRFPVEAGIAPHARVMDEREVKAAMTAAEHRIFARSVGPAGDAALEAALNHLAGLLQPGDFSVLIGDLMRDRTRLGEALNGFGGLAPLLQAINDTVRVRDGRTTEDAIRRAAAEDEAFDRLGLQAITDAFRTGSKTENRVADAIDSWLTASPHERCGNMWSAYCAVYLTREGLPKANRSLVAASRAQSDPDLFDIITTERERIATLAECIRAVRIATGTRYLVTVGTALLAAYEDIKHERAQLDYDDLIIKARDLLADDNAVSWVHFKLDGGIDHILVDEAQDTSPKQWDIITRLSLEMFAGEGTRDDSPEFPIDEAVPPARTIFAVGDEKQSIYSFQGADPAGFARARDQFRARVESAGRRFQDVELIESFRTTKPVLDMVDAVFAQPDASTGVVAQDRPIRHHAHRHAHAGAIELWPAVERKAQNEENPWLPVDQVRERSPLVQTAERIASTIDEWFRRRERLPSADRPLHAGDIMILVERRTRFAEEMVKRLKSRGIEVAGNDRMVLTEHMAVMDLMAVAACALLIDDDLTLATVLKGPFVGLGEEDLFELARRRPGTLWAALRHRATKNPVEPWVSAHSIIQTLRARADTMPPFEFFASLLGADRGRRRLYSRLGTEAGDPINEFLGLTLIYERRHAPNLQGFLQWIREAGTEVKRDLEIVERAVRVMTVHGAKGLEAPVVILPDTCGNNAKRHPSRLFWQLSMDGKTEVPLWPHVKENWTRDIQAAEDVAVADRVAEKHRLLYVAMTRARDRLHITGWEREKKARDAEHGRSPGSWYELIRPALEKAPGCERLDSSSGGQWHRLASPQIAAPEADEADGKPDFRAIHPEPWMTRPPDAEARPPDPLTPSRPVDDEPAALSPFVAQQDVSRFRRGHLIHRLLQTLPDLPANQWESAADMWLARAAADLETDKRIAMRDETLGVLRDPDLPGLFGPDSLAEVPIAGRVTVKGRALAINGQIDRLVVGDEAVKVIDYKTNRPPPETEADVADGYIRQMAAYRAVLRAVYPDRRIDCILLWTDGPRAMLLGDARLETFAEQEPP